jgi:hypothetical protein
MNYKLFCLVILLLFSLEIKVNADTIDYYHIYYNNILINNNSSDSGAISFKKVEIKESDSLSVKYWTDTPCASCRFYLVAIDENNIYVKVTSNIGQGSPLTISMKDILDWSAQNNVDYFNIYYYEEKPAYPIHLFKLVLK